MLNDKEIIRHDLKIVRIKCKDGYTREGKCYVHSELDENDELELYVVIDFVHITATDIVSIEEI